MVDKINGNSSYDFTRQKDGRRSTAAWAYESTLEKSENIKQKKPDVQHVGSSSRETPQQKRGVILDLTSTAKKQLAEKKKPSFVDSLRKIIMPVLAWIKDFWDSDKEPEAGVQAGMAGQEDAGQAFVDTLPPLDQVNEIPDYESMLDDAVKSHDLQKMEQVLTHGGTKHLAHHSDLLTYYDRRGNLVEMDDTAKHRVLFGDKNILKL